MPEPTSIADLVEQTRSRVRQRQAEQSSSPECRRHPGNQAGSCDECDQELLAEVEESRVRAAEESRVKALADGESACRSRFPLRYRDAVTDHAAILGWVKEFIADPTGARSLLVLGPTGTGKTWQCYGALRLLATEPLMTRTGEYRPLRWEAGTFADVVASMRPRMNIDTEEELARRRGLDLLMIDDVGASKASEWVEEVTYRLINGRYEAMRPSIFISNLPTDEFRVAVGDRIASRLAETCVRVKLDGPDRRRQAAA